MHGIAYLILHGILYACNILYKFNTVNTNSVYHLKLTYTCTQASHISNNLNTKSMKVEIKHTYNKRIIKYQLNTGYDSWVQANEIEINNRLKSVNNCIKSLKMKLFGNSSVKSC